MTVKRKHLNVNVLNEYVLPFQNYITINCNLPFLVLTISTSKHQNLLVIYKGKSFLYICTLMHMLSYDLLFYFIVM